MSLEHSKYYRGSTFLANIMSAKEYKMVQMSQLFRDKKMSQEQICNIKGGGLRKLPESLGQPWVGPGLQEVIDDPQLK